MTGRGVVAAGHPVTAAAAVDVLREGGNAFDAAVAALWAACAAEPVLAAPGGGGFLMAYAQGEARLYDFFCDAPRARREAREVEFAEIHADFGTARQAFYIGAGAAATPGFIPGLVRVARDLGTWPMADLVRPAVRAARDGVTMTPFQAFLFQVVAPILTWSAEARAVFAPRGRLLGPGEKLRNPALAETLARLGRGEAERDRVMEAMLRESRAFGSHLEAEDLRGYEVVRREPRHLRLGDEEAWLNPPPALGGALAAAMLTSLAAGGEAASPPARAEAMAAVDAAWRAQGLDAAGLLGLRTPPSAGRAVRGTTHVSVIDREGRAAAATVSNGEGNGRIVPGCGFMLNNMLGEADLNPDGWHAWRPGLRLASMMAPTLARRSDGRLLALGSGGSNRIRTAIFQVLADLLLVGRAAEAAVAAPRLHVEEGRLDVEAAGEWPDLEVLAARFPALQAWPERSLYFGGVHVAERDANGAFFGAGDPRRDGVFLVA